MTAALLLIAIKSILIAAVTIGLLRIAARRSAAERSAIAHLGLCALLALPLGSFLLPSLSIFVHEQPNLKALLAPISVIATPIAVRPPMPLVLAPVTSVATSAGLAHWGGTFVLCVYLAPAIVLLLLTCTALMLLVTLRAHARPVVDPVWLDALDRVRARLGFTRTTELLSGGHISSPISWGLIRPTILLNEEILAASAYAEAIIAHEFAHVIQHDWVKLILARIATAVFWFNPLVWFLVREAHQLREEAADDAVLAFDITGPDYAALLIGIARCGSRGAPLVVHGVAPSRSSLRRRVTRVLDDGSMRDGPGIYQVAALTVAMFAMATPLATLKLELAAGMPQGVRNAIIAASASVTQETKHDLAAPVSSQSTIVPINTPAVARQSASLPSTTTAAPPAKHGLTPQVSSRSTTLLTRAGRVSRPSATKPDVDPSQPTELDKLPQILRNELDAECVNNGGTPGQSPNLFRIVDLNGDGISDLVFDRKNYECQGASIGSGWYGTTLTIFIGGPSNNVAEVYTGSFYGSWIEYGRDGKPSLIVADAADCGKPDADSPNSGGEMCQHQLVFDAPLHDSGLGIKPGTDNVADR